MGVLQARVAEHGGGGTICSVAPFMPAPRLIAAAITVAATLGGVAACGFTTHDLIAHRARTYYYTDMFGGKYAAIANGNVGSVQAGAPFPDYLYECGNDHNDGEDAHWSPFQAAAVTYIHSLPKPWTNSTEALVAFFFGVVSREWGFECDCRQIVFGVLAVAL